MGDSTQVVVHSFEEGRVAALAEECMEVVPGIQKVGVQDNKHIVEGMAGEDRAGDIEGILHRRRDTDSGFLVTQSNQPTNKNLYLTRIKIIRKDSKFRWRHDVRVKVKKTQQSELFTCVHPRHFGIFR